MDWFPGGVCMEKPNNTGFMAAKWRQNQHQRLRFFRILVMFRLCCLYACHLRGHLSSTGQPELDRKHHFLGCPSTQHWFLAMKGIDASSIPRKVWELLDKWDINPIKSSYKWHLWAYYDGHSQTNEAPGSSLHAARLQLPCQNTDLPTWQWPASQDITGI